MQNPIVTDNGAAAVWQGNPYPTLGVLNNRLDYIIVNGPTPTAGTITVSGLLERYSENPMPDWVIPAGTLGQIVPPARYSRRTGKLSFTFGSPADATPGKLMLFARDEF